MALFVSVLVGLIGQTLGGLTPVASPSSTTEEAALQALRHHSPRMLILAVPVCAPETAAPLREIADEVVCAQEPMSFHAAGQFYERFDQTRDDEVLDLLAQASARTEVST